MTIFWIVFITVLVAPFIIASFILGPDYIKKKKRAYRLAQKWLEIHENYKEASDDEKNFYAKISEARKYCFWPYSKKDLDKYERFLVKVFNTICKIKKQQLLEITLEKADKIK